MMEKVYYRRSSASLIIFMLVLCLLLLASFALMTGMETVDKPLQESLIPVFKEVVPVIVLIGVFFFLISHYEKHACVIVNEEYVSLSYPGSRILTLFMPKWKLSLADIERAVLVPGQKNNVDLLLIDENEVSRRLSVRMWSSSRMGLSRELWLRFKANEENLKALLKESDLLRDLQIKGLSIEIMPADLRHRASSGVHLQKYPAAVLVIVLSAFMFIYPLAEMFGMQVSDYAGSVPWIMVILPALLAGILVLLLLRVQKIPDAEAWGLGMLFTVALALTLYFGLLRINAKTADQEWETHVFVLTENGVLRPKDDMMPLALSQPGFKNYWKNRKAGEEREIDLLNGGLGFWQYNKKKLQIQIEIEHKTGGILKGLKEQSENKNG